MLNTVDSEELFLMVFSITNKDVKLFFLFSSAYAKLCAYIDYNQLCLPLHLM